MTAEDIVMHDGKLYVSRKEFARRVDMSERTIVAYTNSGKIPTKKFKKNATKYIEWNSGKAIWDLLPKNHSAIEKGKKSADVHRKYPKEVKEPKVVEPKIADLGIDMPELEILEDLSSFDPVKYSDCIIEGNMDYDKLKLRLTAETYQMKLDKERGLLLDKAVVVTWAKNLGSLLSSGLDAIPQRYTAILTAKCQTLVAKRLNMPEFEFTEQDKAELKLILKQCGPDLMRSLKQTILEMEE